MEERGGKESGIAEGLTGKRIVADSIFQSKKCAKRHHDYVDRISQMPDDILISIISLLSLREATRTSVLSSRWTNLWKHTSRLVFYGRSTRFKITEQKKSLNGEPCRYTNWVNRVFRSRQSYDLKVLIIRLPLNKSSQNAINYWLKYAFAKRVQKLELDLQEAVRPFYTFSKKLSGQMNRASLSKIPSKMSFIDHPRQLIIFQSLKELSFKCVTVSSEVIQSLLHSCPVLENLTVHSSDELTDIEVCGPSIALKHLEILSCQQLRSIRVSNSNIVSINIHKIEALSLDNVPKLVEVCFPLVRFSCIKNAFDRLSCCISQLEILPLKICHIENKFENFKFPALYKLKKLVLKFLIEDDEGLIGLMFSLLTASPNLQELILQMGWRRPSPEKREITRPLGFPHQNLKVVLFSGYKSTGGIELVRCILENSASLEKVIIRPRLEGQFSDIYAKKQLEEEVPPHIRLIFLEPSSKIIRI